MWAMADDDAYDELFAGPVEDFVAKRDALVRQLKADGDKEQAAVVKSWRRPSRAVGALNRLALTDDAAAAEFVESARGVGSSRGPSLREANEQFRAAVKRAASSAVDALDEARPSDLGEVTSALLTLGADTEALESFQEGRLLDLPDAGQSGFGFGSGLDLGSASAPSKPKRATTKKRTAAEREDELAARRQAADRARLEAAADEASTTARKADDAAEAAQERVEGARTARDEAEAALVAAEAEAESAATAAADARRALEEAEAALEG